MGIFDSQGGLRDDGSPLFHRERSTRADESAQIGSGYIFGYEEIDVSVVSRIIGADQVAMINSCRLCTMFAPTNKIKSSERIFFSAAVELGITRSTNGGVFGKTSGIMTSPSKAGVRCCSGLMRRDSRSRRTRPARMSSIDLFAQIIEIHLFLPRWDSAEKH